MLYVSQISERKLFDACYWPGILSCEWVGVRRPRDDHHLDTAKHSLILCAETAALQQRLLQWHAASQG